MGCSSPITISLANRKSISSPANISDWLPDQAALKPKSRVKNNVLQKVFLTLTGLGSPTSNDAGAIPCGANSFKPAIIGCSNGLKSISTATE